MKEQIKQFILTDLLNGTETELAPEQDILSSGMIDSMGIVRLIAFLEQEYGVVVPPEEMVIENFMSVKRISAYIDHNLDGS